MPTTSNLKLPLIAPAQAQKHVTHNEALTALDALIFLAVSSRRRTSPPASPADGERHLIAAAATGSWLGRDKNLAVFLDGGWRYYAPQAGWMARILDERIVLSFDGVDWVDLVNAGGLSSLQNLTRLGVGTTADASNELAFKGNNLLVSAKSTSEGGSGDVRAKINKLATANTASLLFQNGYSARAEIGLIGDDDLVLKLSADGNTWVEAFRARAMGGQLSVSNATADTHALNRITADGRYLALVAQSLTSTQQTQARANLGLGTAAILNAGGANGLAQFNSIGVLALPASALTVGQITLGYGASSIASNVALGVNVLPANTTGANNVGVGEAALLRNTTGAGNVATGRWAMLYNTAGSNNTAVGDLALINNLTGNNNTAVGANALSNVSSALNCSGLGANSQVTGSNQVQLGDSSTTTYVYGTVQNRSDERDKADIRPTRLGLDFVNMLEPVDYRYDLREDYREAPPLAPPALPSEASAEDVERRAAAMSEYVAQRDLWAENSKLAAISRDGSKKRKRYHSGLIAQSVESAVTKTGFDTRGWGAVQNHALSGGDEVMSLGYDQFVPVLVKACQELSARVIALEKRLADTDPA